MKDTSKLVHKTKFKAINSNKNGNSEVAWRCGETALIDDTDSHYVVDISCLQEGGLGQADRVFEIDHKVTESNMRELNQSQALLFTLVTSE